MGRRTALTLLAAVLAAATSPAAPATHTETPVTPDGPFHADAPFIRDEHGRARIFHGVNMVWKRPPYHPPSSIYSAGAVPQAESYLDERDALLLQELGFNTVRLGVLWVGVEPERGFYDEAYLDRIEDLVDLFGDHGIAVMLDFHQDMYNERFEGEGFPDWATYTGVPRPNVSAAENLPEEIAPVPETNVLGFPGNYFTPAVMRAFDNLWENNFGLWADFRDFWRHVAARFRDKPNLVGYDLLNEPWPGSQWATCASPAGCPAFDTGYLQPFYEHVISGIRGVDRHSIIWWEPNVTNDFGAPNHVGALQPLYDPAANTGISFHPYCLSDALFGSGEERDRECEIPERITFERQKEAALRNGAALHVTEFGASDNVDDLERVVRWAADHMVSWHYWHYGFWNDPTTHGPEQGMFEDDLDRGSLKEAKADVLARAYPQAIAGTPIAYRFNRGARTFHLSYRANPAIDSLEHPTEIVLPPRHFPDGFTVVEAANATQVPCPQPRPHIVCFANDEPGPVAIRIVAA